MTDVPAPAGELEQRGNAIFARLREEPEVVSQEPEAAPSAAAASPTDPTSPEVDGPGLDPDLAGPAAHAPEAELARTPPGLDSYEASMDAGATSPPPEDTPGGDCPGAPPVGYPAAPVVEEASRTDPPVVVDGPRSTPVVEERRSRPIPPLPRIIAIANQKGGVGKTTTTVNLGACLADIGYRVLVVDLDPQGNASTGLGINIRGLQSSMYDVMLSDVPIEDCVEASSVRNLFVAPASLDLAGAEIELVPAFSRELRLKQALHEVREDYDYVLIDCPPSLGLLTINGMAAASEVLVPIQCEYYALEGLGQLLRNVGLVQKNLNPTLEVSTIVLVMYDARTKLSDQVATEVRDHFGEKVCRIVIPRTVRLSEAPSFGQPIIAFDPTSRGAVAYRELAKEVSGGPA